MQGIVNRKEYAVKLYDNRKPQSVPTYYHEKSCLQKLRDCPSVVKLHVVGRLQETAYPCIVTVFAGSPRVKLSREQRAAAKEAIVTLHAAGAAHGDIRLQNILFSKDGRCRLADFGDCILQASEEAKDMDLQHLKKL